MMIIDDNDEQFSSYYEYWGNCLKFLEANCSGDSYYEERVYSHQFDGVYYCPWQFPGILKKLFLQRLIIKTYSIIIILHVVLVVKQKKTRMCN